METKQVVCCPTCGSQAERRNFESTDPYYERCPKGKVVQLECPSCDYLMVTCSLDGNVIEACT